MTTGMIFDGLEAKFSREHQATVAIEELSELTKELTKFVRGKGRVISIVEEIGDVQIVLSQLIRNFDPGEKLLIPVRTRKLIELSKLALDMESSI